MYHLCSASFPSERTNFYTNPIADTQSQGSAKNCPVVPGFTNNPIFECSPKININTPLNTEPKTKKGKQDTIVYIKITDMFNGQYIFCFYFRFYFTLSTTSFGNSWVMSILCRVYYS